MMIGPDAFVEAYKDSSYEELMEARDELVKDIKEFEEAYFNDKITDEDRQYLPSPETRYQMNLEYLSELLKLMHDKFNSKYVWSKEE